MLPWTRCFGTSPLAIRLPSVIFDVATILFIYLLGIRLGHQKAGLLGSLLWATAGLPNYLAQEARMYPLVCFLGILATILLLESYRGGISYQRRALGAYVIIILAGLSTSHFFWPVFITHMLYVQFGPVAFNHKSATQAQWQFFTMALASPLLAVAAFQSGRPSYLSTDVWQSVQAYFRLLYVWYSGEALKVSSWLGGLVSLGCILLIVIGVIRTPRQTKVVNCSTVGCPKWLLYAAVTLAFVSIETFALITHQRQSEFTWLEPRTGVIIACGVIPFMVLIADFVARRGLLVQLFKWCIRVPLGPIWLVAFLTFVPVGLLALISMVIPLMADRTVSIFAPYLMLIISFGTVYLCRARPAYGLVIVALLGLNVAGFLEYREQPHSHTDYSALAAQVMPKAQSGDLWFVFRHWAVTPIYYYLDSESYKFVGRNHTGAIEEHPDARVWVLGFEGLPPPPRVTAPLNGHRKFVRIEARGIYADLYVPISGETMEKTSTEDSDIDFIKTVKTDQGAFEESSDYYLNSARTSCVLAHLWRRRT
jgi:uncharacterized membrane protein